MNNGPVLIVLSREIKEIWLGTFKVLSTNIILKTKCYFKSVCLSLCLL